MPDHSKAELARIMGVAPSTARYYCNTLYFNELKELDYRKTQKKFTPAQWHYLQMKLGL